MTNTYEVRDANTIAVRIWDYREQILRDCFIDAADLVLVDALAGTWYAHKVRGNKLKWYALGKRWATGVGNRTVMMHRFILGLTDPLIEADHRDNDGLNNRRMNLRECSHVDNIRFRQPDKDWEAYDAANELAEEYRKERDLAKRIQKRFDLTRQALHFIRRGKTSRSPAALAYAQECIGICRPYWVMQREHPVDNVKWGAVRVIAK